MYLLRRQLPVSAMSLLLPLGGVRCPAARLQHRREVAAEERLAGLGAGLLELWGREKRQPLWMERWLEVEPLQHCSPPAAVGVSVQQSLAGACFVCKLYIKRYLQRSLALLPACSAVKQEAKAPHLRTVHR